MPSLKDSRRQVNASLQDEFDHDAILASLQGEIDRHNAIKNNLADDMRRSKRSRDHSKQPRGQTTKFRFKSGTKDARDSQRQHRSSRRRRDHDGDSHHVRKRKRHEVRPESETGADEPAPHPFPREPADPEAVDKDAFRSSLFDALADDEGAAAYWESVYNQPIHIYPRPTVQDTRTGNLEQMSDEEYVRYVKEKMWERKNPEVVREREKKDKEGKVEEEERTRRREEFVRKKERAAWERSQRWRDGDDEDEEEKERWERYEYVFAGDAGVSSRLRPRKDISHDGEYTTAWATYLNAWQTLLLSHNAGGDDSNSDSMTAPSSRIPWPVLPSKPVLKPNIEAFLNHLPATNSADRLRMLKAERVRWHPDKIQQRFGGKVEEGTMKLVTGVFQVVDGMVEVERKK